MTVTLAITQQSERKNYAKKVELLEIIHKTTQYPYLLCLLVIGMDNSKLTTMSLVAVIVASLLVVGIVTALSMVEQADARKKIINSGSTSASAEGGEAGTAGTGGTGGSGGTGGTGGTAIAVIIQ
jgi:hypothetical protein